MPEFIAPLGDREPAIVGEHLDPPRVVIHYPAMSVVGHLPRAFVVYVRPDVLCEPALTTKAQRQVPDDPQRGIMDHDSWRIEMLANNSGFPITQGRG